MAIETSDTCSQTTTAGHGIVHVELPAGNVDKLCAFYSGVFGWEFEDAPGMATYKMAAPEGEDGPGFAIFARDDPGQRLTNYVGVESISEHAEKITRHGGQVVHRFSVPGMGHGAITLDPEGNALGIWQPDPDATP